MRYLLDTNVVSQLLRAPRGPIAARIREVGEHQVCTSIVVAAELRFGVEKKASMELARRLDAVLGAIEVVPLEPPVDQYYGRIRCRLEQRGTPIGSNDLLIAAHALSLGCTLVTDNEREFRLLEELPVANWIRADAGPGPG